MTDPTPEDPIAKVLRSSLPDDKKRQLIKLLIAERQQFEERLRTRSEQLLNDLAVEDADRLIAEIEQHLREQEGDNPG